MRELNYGTMLLMDPTLIDRKKNIKFTQHQGIKHSVSVLAPDIGNPWEHGGDKQSKRVILYGTTLYDASIKKYRMWYMCRMGPHWRFQAHRIPRLYIPRSDNKPYAFEGQTHDSYGRNFVDNDRGDLTCYAESEDGLNWIKPDLGIFKFNNRSDNNITWDLHGASVFRDETELDSQRRYKAIGFCRRYRNIFLLNSPDGLHWKDADQIEPVAYRQNEGCFNVTYDNVDQCYRAYALIRDSDVHKRRAIAYSESSRLEGEWSDLKPMLRANAEDDQIGQTKYGAQRAEIHNLSAFRYGQLHIGIAGVLYVTGPGVPEHQMPIDGPIDAQLVYSQNGFDWHHFHPERVPIISRGETLDYDSGMIIGTAKEPIIKNDQIHWYYTGCQVTHGSALHQRYKAIGRASWRLDGFVSLDAYNENEMGFIETVPLKIPNIFKNTLQLNADAERGQVLVEVVDLSGKVVEGYASQNCVPMRENSLRYKVNWKSSGQLPTLNEPLKLRFKINKAQLYSFRLVSSNSK